jgi:hypothetical protein
MRPDSLTESAMKIRRAAKSHRVPRRETTEQLVLNAYLSATKDRAFRAFARRVLQAK